MVKLPTRCTRPECSIICILPMYARRCISDDIVTELFQTLRKIVKQNQLKIVCKQFRTNESQTALNLLTYLSSILKCTSTEEDSYLQDTYDVLSAMSGQRVTIFSRNALVDSKLYELVFDLFGWYENKASSSFASLPWDVSNTGPLSSAALKDYSLTSV